MITERDLRVAGLGPAAQIYFFAFRRSDPAHEMALVGEPDNGFSVVTRKGRSGGLRVEPAGTDVAKVVDLWFERAGDVGYLPVPSARAMV